MNIKNEFIKLKKNIEEGKIVNHTRDLFFLIEEGLNDCKKKKNKLNSNENQDDELFYAFCYEYEKGNFTKTFKVIDILNDYDKLCSDTTYFYLNACHGMFNKGYLMELCMEKDITLSIEIISEKENEFGKTVYREMMIFTKPYNRNLIKKRK